MEVGFTVQRHGFPRAAGVARLDQAEERRKVVPAVGMAGAEEVIGTDDGEAHRVLEAVADALRAAGIARRAEEASVRGDEERAIRGIETESVNVDLPGVVGPGRGAGLGRFIAARGDHRSKRENGKQRRDRSVHEQILSTHQIIGLDLDIVPRMKALLSLLASTAVVAVAAAGVHAADRTVLSAGHVDAIAPTVRDGGIALRVLDGTAGGMPVTREPGDVLLHVKPQARTIVPEGLPPSFAFLGAPGSDVWILPQLQDPDLLWAGWSSESMPSGIFREDRLEWTLNRVDGPGPVQLYDTNGIGEPRLFFNSADGLPDTERRPVGAHAHFNWVFHDPGVYTLNFSVSGERTDGTSTQAYAEYRVFVGDLADLAPELVYIDGLQESYDVGATVTLEAEQSPASRFTGFRWLERCAGDGEPRQVATGARYTFTASRSHDGCRLAVALHDDGGRELVRSAEGLINIRSGTWGPRLIMSRGHADVLRVALSGERLDVAIKDDSGDEPVIRRPEEVLLHAKPQAAFLLTAGLPPEFGFLGQSGDTIYLLPEVQAEELSWPGWDTAGVAHGALAGDELDVAAAVRRRARRDAAVHVGPVRASADHLQLRRRAPGHLEHAGEHARARQLGLQPPGPVPAALRPQRPPVSRRRAG